MEKKKFLGSLLCVAAAAAMAALPLVACGGGDNGGGSGSLRGERVTEQEWKDGIDELRMCKNYTETVKTVKNTTGIDRGYDGIYKFDLTNGIVCWEFDNSILEGKIIMIVDDNYYFRLYNYSWDGNDRSYSCEWYVEEAYALYDGHNQFIYACDFYWGGFRNLEAWFYYNNSYEENSMYHKYFECNFDENSGTYVRKENYSAEEHRLGYIFKDKSLVAGEYRAIRELNGKDMEYHITMTISDVGTTVIDVPSDVTDAIDEYKAEHELMT